MLKSVLVMKYFLNCGKNVGVYGVGVGVLWWEMEVSFMTRKDKAFLIVNSKAEPDASLSFAEFTGVRACNCFEVFILNSLRGFLSHLTWSICFSFWKFQGHQSSESCCTLNPIPTPLRVKSLSHICIVLEKDLPQDFHRRRFSDLYGVTKLVVFWCRVCS